MNIDELRAWFDASELGRSLKDLDGQRLSPGLLRRIAHGACMMAYEQGVVDGANAAAGKAKEAIRRITARPSSGSLADAVEFGCAPAAAPPSSKTEPTPENKS